MFLSCGLWMRLSSTFHGWAMGLILFVVGGWFLSFLVPMSYNNAWWRVVQVEPLEFSTTVDNGIILQGLIQVVRRRCTSVCTPPKRGFWWRLLYSITGIWICPQTRLSVEWRKCVLRRSTCVVTLVWSDIYKVVLCESRTNKRDWLSLVWR